MLNSWVFNSFDTGIGWHLVKNGKEKRTTIYFNLGVYQGLAQFWDEQFGCDEDVWVVLVRKEGSGRRTQYSIYLILYSHGTTHHCNNWFGIMVLLASAPCRTQRRHRLDLRAESSDAFPLERVKLSLSSAGQSETAILIEHLEDPLFQVYFLRSFCLTETTTIYESLWLFSCFHIKDGCVE